jgi:holo-[acyl-carrier protein] synthase
VIEGIGNDIVEIKRIASAIERFGQKFLDKLFTQKEQEYCKRHEKSERNFSGRFAAKESIAKALGTGFGQELNWLDIEILNESNGKPVVFLSESLKKRVGEITIHLSISHSKEFAVAVAIAERQ